jgi:hypothetical protein
MRRTTKQRIKNIALGAIASRSSAGRDLAAITVQILQTGDTHEEIN